ncbi:hypothetical protein JHW41_22490 [Lysobacter enzymogenes]|nr:hypothetical protein JHW41_22490 [Lysobacter enzymogenes]
MFLKAGRMALLLGVVAHLFIIAPYPGIARAQWDDGDHRDWSRDRNDYAREDWRQRDRERKRREEAQANGVVAGVVGAAVLATVIAAAAKRDKENRSRADYCISRYGNYNRANDTYRAADGYTYRCE